MYSLALVISTKEAGLAGTGGSGTPAVFGGGARAAIVGKLVLSHQILFCHWQAISSTVVTIPPKFRLDSSMFNTTSIQRR